MKKIFIFLTVFLLSNFAQAKPYFEGKTIDPLLLDKPFDRNSSERKYEIQKIIKLQQNPDVNDLRQAIEEAEMEAKFVPLAVDAKLTAATYPKFYQLLERVLETSESTARTAKEYWNVSRPFLTDEKIALLVSKLSVGKLSYPSGHTTGGYTLARVCALLIPQKREEFLSAAEKIAQHRVLVGAHFPSDLEAGRKLSLAIVGGLLQNEEFQKDFKEAKTELETKHD